MNILYLVHQNILFEDSGTPVVTNQYAQEAIKLGYQVAIISAKNNTTPFFYDGVHYVPVEPLEDWSEKAFLKDQNIGKIKVNLPFEPDIIHIIDWVNINPRIINFLKTLNKPIIRHFCNFEDICYFHHPFHQHKNLSVCKNKLTSAICSRCIANKTFKDKKVFKKIKSIIFNEKKKDELKYFKLLESRNETVNQQLNKNYDYFIFPSNKFSKYFFSHVNIKKRFDVIPHGIKKNYRILEKNKNISKFNIIFIGGIDKRKGWSIVVKALNELLKMTNSEIAIRIYGDKKKTSKSILSKYKNVEFFDKFKSIDLPDILSWADIGILPSFFETYNLLLREFIYNNVVPITSNFFGADEIIDNKKNGIIIYENSSQQLFKNLSELINNKSFFLSLRNNLNKTNIISSEEEFKIINEIYKKINSNF
jgi:glycosyltransferase involved in cell wall biosynthesis